MANAYISEYDNIIIDDNGRQANVALEPSTAQVVTYTTSAQSVALSASTRFVRIICDAKAHFVFGRNPTATANDAYIPADVQEYFGVVRGESMKIAFYDGSS